MVVQVYKCYVFVYWFTKNEISLGFRLIIFYKEDYQMPEKNLPMNKLYKQWLDEGANGQCCSIIRQGSSGWVG